MRYPPKLDQLAYLKSIGVEGIDLPPGYKYNPTAKVKAKITGSRGPIPRAKSSGVATHFVAFGSVVFHVIKYFIKWLFLTWLMISMFAVNAQYTESQYNIVSSPIDLDLPSTNSTSLTIEAGPRVDASTKTLEQQPVEQTLATIAQNSVGPSTVEQKTTHELLDDSAELQDKPPLISEHDPQISKTEYGLDQRLEWLEQNQRFTLKMILDLLAMMLLMGFSILWVLVRHHRATKRRKKADMQSVDRQRTRVLQPDKIVPRARITHKTDDLKTGETIHEIYGKPTNRLESHPAECPSGPADQKVDSRLFCASHKGYVREENQDAGLCFSINGVDVLVVADGLGGHPHGRKAAFMAVEAVRSAIEIMTRPDWPWRNFTCEQMAMMALHGAQNQIKNEADQMGLHGISDGLCTTLIVIAANRHQYGYAYIGDGGGLIVREDQSILHFLSPQKASANVQNVLTGCLGPERLGNGVGGQLDRKHGDWIMIGSDGVFDRVPEDFPYTVKSIMEDGTLDPQVSVQDVLESLATFQDERGYVCDDNMTLALMHTTFSHLSPIPGSIFDPDTPSVQLSDVHV